MTITVKFFSLIREAVETEQLVLELNEKLTTVEALKNELGLRGEAWKEALSHPNLIQAVNPVSYTHLTLPTTPYV